MATAMRSRAGASPTGVRVSLVLCELLAIGACGSRPAEPQAELVGDPLGTWRTNESEAFARNLWDLQEHHGRLYLGYGDAIANTGPTQVLAYDPHTDIFTTETVIPEEAILTLHVFDDRLYIPGVDAVDSPDGAIYVRDGDEWHTLHLADVVHVPDVLRLGTRLCVAVQDRILGGAVRCSDDEGASWSSFPTGGFRAASLFAFGGTMYVSSHHSGFRRIMREGTTPAALVIEGVADTADVLVSRPITCGSELAFIAKRITYQNDRADVEVLGLFHASGEPMTATRAAIEGTPNDLFVNDGHCYALVDHAAGGAHEVALLRSEDSSVWKRIVGTRLTTLARSAELMDGYVYIGTGCDAGHCSDAAGHLLRLKIP